MRLMGEETDFSHSSQSLVLLNIYDYHKLITSRIKRERDYLENLPLVTAIIPHNNNNGIQIQFNLTQKNTKPLFKNTIEFSR